MLLNSGGICTSDSRGACLYLANLAYDLVTIPTVRLSSLLPGHTSMLVDLWAVSFAYRVWRRAPNNGQDVREHMEAMLREEAAAAAAPAQLPPAAAPEPVPAQELEPEPEPFQVNTDADTLIWTQQAVFLPLITRGVGEVLKRLAGYWRPAQQVLGIRSPMTSIGITLSADILTDVNYWKRFTVWLWSEAVDPVWIRNALGFGLFCITKDCLHAYYVRLKKNEIKSRRIRSRNFEGLDPRRLDLIHPVT